MLVSRKRLLPGIATLVKALLWVPSLQVLWCSPAFGQTLAAPANLSATTLTANRVDLSWQDAAIDEDGFSVERAPDLGGIRGAFAEIATVPPDSIAFADKGLLTAAIS